MPCEPKKECFFKKTLLVNIVLSCFQNTSKICLNFKKKGTRRKNRLMEAAPTRTPTLSELIRVLFIRSKQNKRFIALKKMIEKINPLELTPEKLVAAMCNEEGPIFIDTEQACELKNTLNGKYPDLPYQYHHVVCSRVLDPWNLLEFYGTNPGSCYYGLSAKKPTLTSDLEDSIAILFTSNNLPHSTFPEAYRNADQEVKDFIKRLESPKNMDENKKKRARKGADNSLDLNVIMDNKRSRRKVDRFSP